MPAAGLTGVAFVLPTPANPAARAGHRVYLKRMLLAEGAEGLLPEWAFFARCVVDTTELRPTASREALYEDALLEATRDALGDQLRDWLVRLATEDRRRVTEFLDIHQLGVKALALHDDEMLRLVERYWPMETNVGRMTLADFRAEHDIVRYVVQVEEFRQLGAVAAAQGMPLVNGGYEYDTKIIERLPQAAPGALIERVEPSDLTTHFDQLELGVELAQRPFVARAQRAVDRLGCEVVLRSFDPAGLPALYLVNSSAAFAAELRATRDRADDVWADVLDALARTDEADRPQLVLNYRNPLVRRISELTDDELVRLAVEALYGQALLLGHHPIRPADAALLNSSFLGLLEQGGSRGAGVKTEDELWALLREATRCRTAAPRSRSSSGSSSTPTPRATTSCASPPGCRRRTPTCTAASRPSRSSRSPGAGPSTTSIPSGTTAPTSTCCCGTSSTWSAA